MSCNSLNAIHLSMASIGLCAVATAHAEPYAIERVARIPPAESWEFQSLILGSDGKLYGTATVGETGYGKLFRLPVAGGDPETIYDFPGSDNDGYRPLGSLVLNGNGSLSGTTATGNRFQNTCGSVFTVTQNGAVTLHALFDGRAAYGCAPYSGLVVRPDGAFIGTTSGYSPNARDNGSIFRVAADSTAPTGQLVTLTHRFADGEGGANPLADLIEGPDGRLYGSTHSGGQFGKGTLFSVASDGSGFIKLLDFNGSNGAAPQAALTIAPDNTLWGTTALGGANGVGTIFKLTTSGQFTSMHSMTSAEGEVPSKLTVGADRNFYGTAKDGGSANLGSVFRITPAGVFTKILDITSTFKHPVTGLVSAPDNMLYGATAFEIFRINGVSNGQPPSLTLSFSSDTINAGGSTTLSWTSTQATRCAGTEPTSFTKGSFATSGSRLITDKNTSGGDTMYSMTCTGPDGDVSASTTLHVVAPAPTLTLTADPMTLPAGSSSTLTWAPTNAKSCVASGTWSGEKNAKGNSTSIKRAKAGVYAYTLTCSNDAGSVERTVNVTFQ